MHKVYLQRAVELALEAEAGGNLPIGALIVLRGEIIAEGSNALLVPDYNPGRHGEIETIKKVAVTHWPNASEMICYTTLEPCVMCYSTLLLHGVGKIVFGATDPEGGFRFIEKSLPPFYKTHAHPAWEGPLAPELCDPLYTRAKAIFSQTPVGRENAQ